MGEGVIRVKPSLLDVLDQEDVAAGIVVKDGPCVFAGGLDLLEELDRPDAIGVDSAHAGGRGALPHRAAFLISKQASCS